MASVTPRRNPSGKVVWRVQFRVNGQSRQESFPTHEAARAFGELVDRIGGEAARKYGDTRAVPQREGHTLGSWTDYYLTRSHGFINRITEGTLGDYRRDSARSFLAFMGDLPLEAIGREQVGEWLAWQKIQPTQRTGLPMAVKTISNYQGLLSSILSAPVAAGHVEYNAAYRAAIGEGEQVRDSVFLSQREFGVLLRYREGTVNRSTSTARDRFAYRNISPTNKPATRAPSPARHHALDCI